MRASIYLIIYIMCFSIHFRLFLQIYFSIQLPTWKQVDFLNHIPNANEREKIVKSKVERNKQSKQKQWEEREKRSRKIESESKSKKEKRERERDYIIFIIKHHEEK